MTRFSCGDRVRVRQDFPPGHVRTPVYLRGQIGTIEYCHGTFENAETAAHRLPAPKKEVYKVRFAATDVWPDYVGSRTDAVEADLYEHWLAKIT